MDKRKYVLLFGVVLLIMAIGLYFFQMNVKKASNSNHTIVNGIENFRIADSEADYILIYPADWRTSQNYTLIKEVNQNGEVLEEYRIVDEDFRRASVHQKPNDEQTLYLSLFGEPVVQNWFYTFDLQTYQFKHMPIDYFTHETGVNHIMHYGEDVVFNTIVSHKTGDQVYNPNTGDFKVSISNFTKEKSYETEWGLEPSWTPIVQWNGHLIYAGDGKVNDAGLPEDTFVAIVHEKDGSIETTNFELKGAMFAPIYANDEHAFILAHTGEMIVLDSNLDYEIFYPYEQMEEKQMYYISDGYLMLDDERALQVISNDDRTEDVLGFLTLSKSPIFTPLKKDYMDATKNYRILYQDVQQGVIFIIESEGENGHVLVIDNKEFDLINRFPVDYPYLLDIIVKK